MSADELLPWINSAGEGGVHNTMQEYPGNGTPGPWEFNFAGPAPGYIDQSHVKAYRYDPVTALTYQQTLTFNGPNQVTTSDVIPTGQFVIVYRDTPKDQPLVNYSEGSVMDETNLDMSNQQAVYAAAEMVDRFDSVNATSSDAAIRAASAYNQSLAAQADATTALNKSTIAVDTSNAANAASASATATANAAKATADGIDGKAQQALDNSTVAVATANAAKSTADGIDAKAQSALDASASAVSTANSATNTANAASTTANGVDAKAQTALDNSAAAVTTANAAAQKSANLNDLSNKPQARVNLGTAWEVVDAYDLAANPSKTYSLASLSQYTALEFEFADVSRASAAAIEGVLFEVSTNGGATFAGGALTAVQHAFSNSTTDYIVSGDPTVGLICWMGPYRQGSRATLHLNSNGSLIVDFQYWIFNYDTAQFMRLGAVQFAAGASNPATHFRLRTIEQPSGATVTASTGRVRINGLR